MVTMKPGHWYVFHHKRKGSFFAKFVEEEPNPGDLVDPLLVVVDVWTQAGSGQERLANAAAYLNGVKQPPIFSPKKLRMSQLNSIDTPNTVTQERLKSLDLSPVKGAEYSHEPPPLIELEVPEPKRRFGIFGRKK